MERRGFLKLGAGFAAGVPALMSGQAAAQLISPDTLPPDLEVRPSPPTTPFLAPLQIPTIKRPINDHRIGSQWRIYSEGALTRAKPAGGGGHALNTQVFFGFRYDLGNVFY